MSLQIQCQMECVACFLAITLIQNKHTPTWGLWCEWNRAYTHWHTLPHEVCDVTQTAHRQTDTHTLTLLLGVWSVTEVEWHAHTHTHTCVGSVMGVKAYCVWFQRCHIWSVLFFLKSQHSRRTSLFLSFHIWHYTAREFIEKRNTLLHKALHEERK